MGDRRLQLALTAAIVACMTTAAVLAARLDREAPRPDPCLLRGADPAAVEASFSEILAAEANGDPERALLALRRRAERGPHPGYARFLLGELAYAAGAYPSALDHWRQALAVDPGIADPQAAFAAGRTLAERLETLRSEFLALLPPSDREHLYTLVRRLAGGCE